MDSPARAALRTTMRLLWSQADAHARRQLALSFLLLICFAGLGALAPVAYKLVLDGLAAGSSAQQLATPLALIAVYVACQYVLRIAGELRGFAHGRGLQRLDRRLSLHLFAHVLRLPLSYHLGRKTGAISATLGQGLSGCQTLLQHFVFTFLPVLIEFAAMALVLTHLGHGRYLAIMALASVAYVMVFSRAARQIVAPAEALSNAHVDAHATLTDGLLNYETVKYFGGEASVGESFDRSLEQREAATLRLLRLKVANGLGVATIFTASLAVSLGMAGAEVLRGAMTLGDFVLINAYVARLVQPLEVVGFAVRDVSQGLAFLRKMLEVLQERAEPDPPPMPMQATVARGELAFEGVSLSYREGRTVLRDVTFSVPAGKTVAIVGMSGSGKSSLIRLLFRLYEPDGGRILLDGQPISNLPLAALRRSIAVVPQDTVLFNDTLEANIAFARPGSSRRDVEEAARIAHLERFIASLPEGYETRVGERGLRLSGGERQRVAIARAALKRPRIFVFDEATSSLDSRTEREILRGLIEVASDSTTLVIAHRLSTVIHADEILVLHEGSIVERGAHAALLERGGAYAALWKAQQGVRPGSGAAA